MTVIEIIDVIYQSMFICIFAIAFLASAIYAALSLSKEAKQAKEEAKKAEEEAEEYFERLEAKLNIVLEMHNCIVNGKTVERPALTTRERLHEMSDKLDVLLCGPMDKETLEELRAGREAKSTYPGHIFKECLPDIENLFCLIAKDNSTEDKP